MSTTKCGKAFNVIVDVSQNNFIQMTVTYQVGGGGHLDIDFWVRVTTVVPFVIHIHHYTCNTSWQTQITTPSTKTLRNLLELYQ